MNTSLPRVAPASAIVAVHTPPSGPAARATATEQAPERGAPARPFADMLRQRRADASPPAAAPAPPSAPSAPSAPDGAAPATAPAEAGPEADRHASTPETNHATTPAKGRSATSSRLAVRPEEIAAEPTSSETPATPEAALEPIADRSHSPADAVAARPLPVPDERVAIALPQGNDGARTTAPDVVHDGQRSDFGGVPGSAGSVSCPVSDRLADGAGPASRDSAASEASKPCHAQPALLVADGTTTADAVAHRPPTEAQPVPAPLAPLVPLAPLASLDPLAPLAPPAAPPSAPLAASGPAATNPSVPTLALPTPVDSPQFAGALGVHVSVLARGGVQHAELHLNPAEMGPVSIRIELSGNDAQVQFGADLAQTRQAIERGLPELASALRDAGFTLSGGGVSQHGSPRGGAGGGDHGPTPGMARAVVHGETVLPGADASRAVRHVAAGGVDVYA